MDAKVMGFDKGVDYIVNTILDIKARERPVLVSVHGHPNSGKTTLLRAVRDQLYNNHNSLGWMGLRDDSLDRFLVTNDPDYFLIEDSSFPDSVNRYTKRNFGRSTNLSVYITKNLSDVDPKLLSEIKGCGFDFIIENPNSKKKNMQISYERAAAISGLVYLLIRKAGN